MGASSPNTLSNLIRPGANFAAGSSPRMKWYWDFELTSSLSHSPCPTDRTLLSLFDSTDSTRLSHGPPRQHPLSSIALPTKGSGNRSMSDASRFPRKTARPISLRIKVRVRERDAA